MQNETTKLLQYCKQAYDDDSLQEGFYHYYIASENLIVIAGSNSFSDWYLFNLRPFPLNPFHNAFQQLAQKLFNFYSPYINDETVICGHSAGGCLAFILAELSSSTSVSFGSPLLVQRKYVCDSRASHTMYSLKYDPVAYFCNYKSNNIEVVEVPGVGHRIEKYIKSMYDS